MVVACCYACAKWVQCWNLTSLFQLEWGFFKDISYASWVLVNMMMESSCCFQKCSRNSGHRCLYNGLPQNLGRLLFSMPTVDSWWSQWGVIAARHCYSQSWWGWWSHTLWVTVIRLWQHCVLSELVVVLLELTEWFCLQKCCCLLWILIDMLKFSVVVAGGSSHKYFCRPLWSLLFRSLHWVRWMLTTQTGHSLTGKRFNYSC